MRQLKVELLIENYNSKGEKKNLLGNGNNEENAARAWAFAKIESLKNSNL